MASSDRTEIKDLITCAHCKELFDDPRLMPCSDTYCRKCIEKEDRFVCLKHDECIILKKDIDSLPLNLAIRDLVELYSK
jgi:hypothetical protein